MKQGVGSAVLLVSFLILGVCLVIGGTSEANEPESVSASAEEGDMLEESDADEEGVRATIMEILLLVDNFPYHFTDTLAYLEVEDPRFKITGIAQLEEIRDVRSVEPLIIILLEDKNAVIRSLAAMTLGTIGDPRALDPLLTALEDESSHVRQGVAVALGDLRYPRAVAPLVALLQDESSHVRECAAEALGEIKQEGTVNPLIRTLADESSFVRARAVWALGEMKDLQSIDPLIEALEDESPHVRENAVEALEKLTDQDFGDDVAAWREWREGDK